MIVVSAYVTYFIVGGKNTMLTVYNRIKCTTKTFCRNIVNTYNGRLRNWSSIYDECNLEGEEGSGTRL